MHCHSYLLQGPPSFIQSFFHFIHPNSIWSPSTSFPIQSRIIHSSRYPFIIHAFYISKITLHPFLHPTRQITLDPYSSFLISSFLIPSQIFTPYILLKHFITTTFYLLFSLVTRPHVSAPYNSQHIHIFKHKLFYI